MEIILIRHGRPTAAINPIVNAQEYEQWVTNYNTAFVCETSRPAKINQGYGEFYRISSDYPRAIHSTEIYTGKSPIYIDELYREMDIPYYFFPFTFKAWTWLYASRLLWILGVKGPFESFIQAKERALLAAEQLIEFTEKQPNIVVFGHGFMNRYIRKALIKKGWKLVTKSNEYWGETRLIK